MSNYYIYKYSGIKMLLIVLFTFGLNSTGFSQNKKRDKLNWLEQKQSNTSRIRMGGGVHTGIITGAHLQLYKLYKVCIDENWIGKKMALDFSVSKEGFMFGNRIDDNSWQSGGVRYGVEAKFYFPYFFNPYVGIGVEGGSRNFGLESKFYPDATASVGVEQKIFGAKINRNSFINAHLFLEGKFNSCLTNNFNYFLPTFGLRLHAIH